MSSNFCCIFHDKEVKVEWYRDRISTRNVASVFPDRPRYVLIDTSMDDLMIVPGPDGYFEELEDGHDYLVPFVKESKAPVKSPPPSDEVFAAAAAKAREMQALSPPTSSTMPTTPTTSHRDGKKTLKGLIANRKGKGGGPEKSHHRRSANKAVLEQESSSLQRRRSSTLGKNNNFSWGSSTDKDDDLDNSPGSSTPNIPKATEPSVYVTKDTMAMGPLSPDVREGDVYPFHKLDVDGNVEVTVRGQPHLIRLDCVEVCPIDNPSSEAKALYAELAQKRKDKKIGGSSSIRRTAQGQRKESVLGQIRSKMAGRGSEKEDHASLSGSAPEISVVPEPEPVDEKLNPSSVYGKPLEMNDLPIPGPIKKCIEFFRREDHIKYEGIFRVPGSSNAVMRIRNKFLVASKNDWDIPDDENPTVVASALKAFLFELPEPLFPVEKWYELMEITDNRDFELDDAVALMEEMPDDNYGVLEYLFEFLSEVSQYSASNKMSPANLGMVFGIVLVRPPDNNVSNVGSSMPKEICTFFVENVDDIFNEEVEESD